MTELYIHYYRVPIAVYHHEPSGQKFIELGIQIVGVALITEFYDHNNFYRLYFDNLNQDLRLL